ncbi:autotransporter domain-containing protein [Aquabacterium sp.]|uniref:autotransporter domain-containing protein n=1 Tax=Aquabacterium sp. TaxID=1872578 RepID=UPI002489EF68|nr:autotransporter domain-containing protein [Aquabacterium sp.]MDI1260543.1 autotransporter domain-containing protein [Aquabacterium sp.]
MNNFHRVVWSERRQAFVVTHEAVSSRGKPSSTTRGVANAVAAMLVALGSGQALAACPAAVSGVITISTATTSECSLSLSDSIVITGTGTIEDSYAIAVSNGAQAGSIQNAGFLNGTADTAINVYGGSVLASITNTGTIQGLSIGILIQSQSTITGGITNSGLIEAPDEALYIEDSTVSGGIVNSGTITADDYGIYLDSSSLAGGISNSGHINSTTDGSAILIDSSTVTGGIINTGTISTIVDTYDYAGIDVQSSEISGGITNSGLIELVTTSEWGYGINLEGSTVTGSINNSGTISATAMDSSSGYGLRLSDSTLVGGITNSGLIMGFGDDTGFGIALESSNMSGAIVNTGTIQGLGNGQGDGIHLDSSTVSGGITNSGLIEGRSAGIYISDSTVGAPLSNLSGGTISGAEAGLYVTSSTITGGVNNAGLIYGENKSVWLANSSDAFTLTNTGTLQGDADMGINTLDLNGPSSRVDGDTTGTGAVNVNGTFTSEGTFDVGTFTIHSGGVFNMEHNVTVSGGASNAGILNVGSGTRTLTGDYEQAAGGTFRLSLSDASSYGSLQVSGNASLADNTKVNVNVIGAPVLVAGSTVAGIITTTGAFTGDASTMTVTDNSALYNFTAATVSNVGHALDLIISADTGGLTTAVAQAQLPAASGAAQVLQNLLNEGPSDAMQTVFDRLNNMSNAEAAAAVSQTLPTIVGAAAQAGITALHSMNKVIQSRIESNQGLSAGNAGPDRYVWVRALGNWSEQDDHNNVSGFDSSTGGLVFGVDAPVNDRIRAGAAFTYAKSSIDSKSSTAPSAVDVDTYELVGYASYNIDPQTDINYQVDIGQNKARSIRQISFMGTQAQADFDSLALHGSVGIGRVMSLAPKTSVTPSVRLDYTIMRTDGYTETGAGPLNLQVEDQTYREFLVTADLKLSHQFEQGVKLIANGGLGYDTINKQAKTTTTFTGGGPAFVTDGLKVSPVFYRAGIGLVKETQQGVEYSARYDMEGRSSGYLNQTVSAKVRWAF